MFATRYRARARGGRAPRRPPVGGRSPDGGRERSVVVYGRITDKAKAAMEELFEVEYVPRNHWHTHPVLATLRRLMELKAFMLCLAQGVVMEVGAGARLINSLTVAQLRMVWFNCFSSSAYPGSVTRAERVVRRARERGVVALCHCDVRRCSHLAGVDCLLFVHVMYYLTPAALVCAMQATRRGVAYIVTHVFTGDRGKLPLNLAGKENPEYAEAEWVRNQDGLIEFSTIVEKGKYPPHSDMAWVLEGVIRPTMFGPSLVMRVVQCVGGMFVVECRLGEAAPAFAHRGTAALYRVPISTWLHRWLSCPTWLKRARFMLRKDVVDEIVNLYTRNSIVSSLDRNAEPLATDVLVRAGIDTRDYEQYIAAAVDQYATLKGNLANSYLHYGHLERVALGQSFRRAERGRWWPVVVAWALAVVFYMVMGPSDITADEYEQVLATALSRGRASIGAHHMLDYLSYEVFGWWGGLVNLFVETVRARAVDWKINFRFRAVVHGVDTLVILLFDNILGDLGWCKYLVPGVIHALLNAVFAEWYVDELVHPAWDEFGSFLVVVFVCVALGVPGARVVGWVALALFVAQSGTGNECIIRINGYRAGQLSPANGSYSRILIERVVVPQATYHIDTDLIGKNATLTCRYERLGKPTFSEAFGLVVALHPPWAFATAWQNEMRGLATRMLKPYLHYGASVRDSALVSYFQGVFASGAAQVTDFSDWAARRGGRMYATFLEAQPLGMVTPKHYGRKIMKRDVFVKVETNVSVKHCYVDEGPPYRDPRIIMGSSHVVSTVVGPFFARVAEIAKQTFDHTRDVFYATSTTPEALGHWLGRMASQLRTGLMVLGDDMVVVYHGKMFEADISRMDGNTCAERFVALHSVYRHLGLPSRGQRLLRKQIDKFGGTKNGVSFKCHGCRASGDDDTTLGNTLLNIGYMRPLLEEALVNNISVAEVCRYVVNAYRLLGWELDMVERDMDNISFCSGLFWPVQCRWVEGLGFVDRVYGPKVGRFIARFGHDAHGNGFSRVKYLRSIAQGWRNSLQHVPLLGDFIRSLQQWAGEGATYERVVRALSWRPSTGEAFDASADTWRMFVDRYQMTKSEIASVAQLLERVIPGPLVSDDPALVRMVERDL